MGRITLPTFNPVPFGAGRRRILEAPYFTFRSIGIVVLFKVIRITLFVLVSLLSNSNRNFARACNTKSELHPSCHQLQQEPNRLRHYHSVVFRETRRISNIRSIFSLVLVVLLFFVFKHSTLHSKIVTHLLVPHQRELLRVRGIYTTLCQIQRH